MKLSIYYTTREKVDVLDCVHGPHFIGPYQCKGYNQIVIVSFDYVEIAIERLIMIP